MGIEKIRIIKKFTVRDIVFIAVLSAVLTIFGMVTMPLVMTVTLFGVRNAAAAVFYGFFSVIGLMKVRKPGTLMLIGVFNGAILLMMSPVMFLNNVSGALAAEIAGLLIFKSYDNDKGAVLAAGLFIPFTLPCSILFGMLLNGYTFDQVVGSTAVSLGVCGVTVVLSFLGSILGLNVCRELRRAGKLN